MIWNIKLGGVDRDKPPNNNDTNRTSKTKINNKISQSLIHSSKILDTTTTRISTLIANI